MTERERFELIDRYFKGELSNEELEEFNSLYNSDPEFVEEVANHEQVNNVIIDAGLIGVKEKLQSIHNKQFNNHKNGKLVKGGIIGTVGLIIIASLGFYFFSINEEEKSKAKNQGRNTSPVANIQKETNNDSPENGKSYSENSNNSKSAHSKPEKPNQPNKKGSPENTKPREKENLEKMSRAKDESKIGDQIAKQQQNKQQTIEKVQTFPRDSFKMGPKDDKKQKSAPCKEVKVTANYRILKSCKDKNRGAIIIDTNSIIGGTPPYRFSLSSDKNYRETNAFTELKRGYYSIHIKDSNGCKSTLKNLYIPAKDCEKHAYTFVPKKEEAWELPFEKNASGELKIYTKGGKLVFQQTIKNGIPSNWRGLSNDGSPLPMGLYLVTFKKNAGNVTKTWNLSIIK